MSTPHGEFEELPQGQRATVEKCEQVVDEYKKRRITKASAVRSLTAAVTASEARLDNAAIDSTLDSYLTQLDDADHIRKEVGQELQQRFRGQAHGEEDESRGADQRNRGTQDTSQTTLRTRSASEQPRPSSAAEDGERSRSPSHEPSADDGHRDKRSWPDPSKFPWAAPQCSDKLLRLELKETLKQLKDYALDVKFTRSDLINSAAAPEFPESEWTNILNGHAVDLDHVLSNLYTLSSDDKHIEHVGDVELRYRTVAPVKTVQSAGDWVLAWQQTVLATVYAFPHRRAELDAYHSHIFGLFAAVDKSLHHRVIHYDRAVRKRVGSVRNLLLSDVDQFHTLRTSWIDSCGANVMSDAGPSRSTRSRRDREACIRWNKGLCTAHASDCRYRHVCSLCGGNHTKRNCKREQ